MRIRHSLTTLVPVVVLLLRGLSAEAQYGPPHPSPGPVFYNGSPGYGPPPGPAYGQVPPGGFPPSYRPHPMISPYDNMLEQHYNNNGTWFRNATNGFGPYNRPKHWFYGIDYLRTSTRKLNGIVGADGVQSYLQQMDPASNGIVDGDTFYNYFSVASADLIPRLQNNGIKLNGGFWNPDGTGLLLNASWVADNTAVFDARRNIEVGRLSTSDVLRLQRSGGVEDLAPFNLSGTTDREIVETDILGPGLAASFDTLNARGYGLFGSTFDILDRTVLNLYGLPITSGSDPFFQTGGYTVPYDLDFILSHSVSTMSAGAAAAFAPIYDHDGIKVRPFVGGRFYRIDEQFGFRGVSTLLSYGLENADADTEITAKVFPVQNGIDENGDFIADNPNEDGDATFGFTPGFSDTLIVRSFVDSVVVSDMGGAEFGLHYELGDDKGIKITGSTRLAALFNHERLKLRGDNIGNFMGQEVIPDPITGANILFEMFDTDTTNGPSQNAFSDSSSSTHLSPLFEQGLNAEIPIFGHVPVLKDMWQLDNAKLNLGWSYLLIGKVADPNQSVVWDSRPITGIFPSVRPDRRSFSQNAFSVGINWTY